MKKIGIVGGVGWRSTVEYYAGICELSEERNRQSNASGDQSIPEIALESLDLAKAVRLLGNEQDEQSWEPFEAYHRDALIRLRNAGADFAVMASNTPHHRFAQIVQDIEIPVIDLFNVTARAAATIGAREVVILGTAMTMESRRFRMEFEKLGVRANPPVSPLLRARVFELIAQLQGGAAQHASAALDTIVREVSRNAAGAAPAICLSCTELPLAFPERRLDGTFLRSGIRYLSTTALHIRAATDLCLSCEAAQSL